MELEPTTITCPRCGGPAATRFYGPCDDCRAVLRDTMRLEVEHDGGGEPGEAGAGTRFEPRMHVVPNQVAMKE